MKHWTKKLVLLVVALVVAPLSTAQAAPRCFSETSQCIDGRFREYWEQSGGLPVFGFPMTPETFSRYPTQIFERNSFERHYENQAPYDVLLGRLGDVRLRQQGRDWQTFPKADAGAAHYFSETGHGIAHDPFWRYWSTHGLELGDPGVSFREALALWGLPLSEPTMETNGSGDTVLTQWFERARFEDHGQKGVLLGLLGAETSNLGGLVPGAPTSVTFTGSGSQVLPKFTPLSKYNRVVSEHVGSSNFIVYAYDEAGEQDLVANTIGTSRDVRALEGLDQRYLEVKADGTWKVTVEVLPFEPNAASGFSGTGSTISGLFTPAKQGAVPFSFTYSGRSNFIVYVKCAGGSDLGANEIGSGQSEAVIEFRQGPCYWEVDADGSWSFQPK